MTERVVDISLSNDLLRLGNTLGRTLGNAKLRSLTSSHEINLAVGEYSLTLGRSGQNLETLYRHLLDKNEVGVPYDQLTIIRGDNEDTHILATGRELCLSTSAATIEELAQTTTAEKHDTYNTLAVGQIALLRHRDSPGGGEFVEADSVQTLCEIDTFLAQR